MNIEQRLDNIKTVEDIDKQILLAKKYFMQQRANSKKDCLSLEEKLKVNTQAKLAEKTMRQLRRISFDVEDALLANKTALSVLNDV